MLTGEIWLRLFKINLRQRFASEHIPGAYQIVMNFRVVPIYGQQIYRQFLPQRNFFFL